jgi:AT-binding transcription factor 1
LLQGKNVPETPVVHSYRVHSARRQNSGKSEPASRGVDIAPSLPNVVPVKPILMCFICKLSFSCAKSFGTHCVESHAMEMTEEEKQTLLESENSSAIIQSVGKDKEVTLSFLEPVINSPSAAVKPPVSPGAITSFLSALASTGLPLSQKSSSSQPDIKSEPKITMLPPSRLFPDSTETRLSPPSISPADTPTSHLSGSPSPVSALSSLGSFPPHLLGGQAASNSSALQGTTIGACPDHLSGRPTGAECSKCDLILNSTRLAGGSSWNMSRNSCKTLKCPKCNWHYKYQETLEIHMKEKHPESETTCIYCITGQQHPRLARGETYTCGYKPYRCEVCNYSTTTKGNLSIHMQSDKHLNNIQDLQNGTSGGSALPSSPIESSKMPQSPVSQRPPSSNPQPVAIVSPSKLQQPAQPQAQKPNWRCDVCNYETNVARNLRIHMTSEKHTHNMMALQQQNAKSLQQLSALHMASGLAGSSQVDPKQFLGGLFGSLPPPPLSNPGASSEAALADLAFNQAVLAQLMAGGQLPGQHLPPLPSPLGQDFNFAAMAAAMASSGSPGHPSGLPDLAELAGEPPSDAKDPNPRHIFTCCVCRCYSCDNIDDLSQHLAQDRSRTRENEVSIVIGGNYLCHLCNYRTNLKANFQLHCKTDKHLQRLSHVNHIKEGGPENEWKLRFITSVNPVDLRCNACDFQTNSPHKIQVHVSNQQHQVSSILFSHLQRTEEMMSNRGVPEERLSFDCNLCKFSCRGKVALMSHVRTVQHLQMEQIHQLQKRAEGNSGHTDIGEIFQVVDNRDEDDDHQSRQDKGK